MSLGAGTVVGEFEIQRPLSKPGAYADVFLAKPVSVEKDAPRRPVFLKVLRQAMASDPKHVARFLREIGLLQSLHSKYFPTFLASGEVEGRPWLALEFIRGRQIFDWVQQWENAKPAPGLSLRAPFMYNDFLVIATQSLLAMKDLAEAGIVHRDLHAGNVLIREGNRGFGHPRIAIVDLGLARTPGDATLTATGEGIGQVVFTAPEQRDRGREANSKSDIYAWASTMSFALTGVEGIPDTTVDRLVHRGVPTTWAEILAPALRSNPDERPDLDSLLDAVKDIDRDASQQSRKSLQAPAEAVVQVHDPEQQDWWVTNNGYLIRRMTFDPLIFDNEIYTGGYLTPAHSCWDLEQTPASVKVTRGSCGLPYDDGRVRWRIHHVDLEWWTVSDAHADPGDPLEPCPRCLSQPQSVWADREKSRQHLGWRCVDMSCRLEDDIRLFHNALGGFTSVRIWRHEADLIVSAVKDRWPDLESLIRDIRYGPTGVKAIDHLRERFINLPPWEAVSLIDGLSCDEPWRARPIDDALWNRSLGKRFFSETALDLEEVALRICVAHAAAWGAPPSDPANAVDTLRERMPRFASLYSSWLG